MFKTARIKVIRSGMALSLAAFMLGACTTSPAPHTHGKGQIQSNALNYTPVPKGSFALRDKTVFLQKDPRWSREQLGTTKGDTLGTDGCLVTAASMALGNLGFETNPSDLNARLTQSDSFTPQGWLIWDGIRKVTNNRAEARFYDEVDTKIIQQCMSDGYYPLVKFHLPSGRSHWAMIVRHSEQGFHMRDPLRASNRALIFPRSAAAFKAVRCIGLKT